ncbi:MAG TPA: flagellar cap protein FliD N-terminal domain-containing protein, partial [Polyangiaceae bacterium]|nr:flagellar cap protein FliD N-terminal domain-containing protein [Polyangiaceae bacterium]
MTTVSVAGYGSGIDVDALVTGLVNASSGNLNLLQQRAADYRSASTTLSSIGTSLNALQSAA